MSPAQAVALRPGGRPLTPMAMVTVDGGGGYWNLHPGDDPMAMVIGELIPRCQRLGLGRPPRRIAVMGTSMGGFGALMLAERYPRLFAAVAAVSPAVWTSYPQARQANAGAFASAAATPSTRASGRWPAPCPPGPWPSSVPAVTTARSSPRRNPRRWPSWLAISPSRPALHPGSILVTPGFLVRSVEMES
jgi:pimeloyl-ACP methyl ester carboxylesterase